MSPGFLVTAALPAWAITAGVASLVAEKNGLSPRLWYVASLLSGPLSWVVLYLKVRDRQERVGPGKKRSGNLEEIQARSRKRDGYTIR